MRRFFGKIEGNKAIVEGEEFKHLSSVIRLKEGDKFICLCNDDFEYTCQIEKIDKRQIVACVLDKNRSAGLPKKNIVLFVALPKKEAFETILQKACELGASKVVPFVSDFVVNKSAINLDRAKAIIQSACKQCCRSKFMEIESLQSFENMCKEVDNFDCILFANEKDGKEYDFAGLEKYSTIAVIVGCEGGFSEKEIEIISEKKNCISLTLGSRILRADTASILMLGLASLFAGN